MGLGRVIYDTLAEFGAHTTIGGLCNAGLTTSRPRQVPMKQLFQKARPFYNYVSCL